MATAGSGIKSLIMKKEKKRNQIYLPLVIFPERKAVRGLQKGMSIAELIIVIGITSLLIVAMGSFQRDILYFAGFIEKGLSGTQDARAILRTMTREARAALPSSIGAYPIFEAGNQSFTFYSDIDNDGLQERVRYFLSGTDLRKGVIKPSGNPLQYNPASETFSTLARDVRNGGQNLFDYYDANYDGTTAALTQPVSVSVVRLVKVTVIIDADINRAPSPKTFMTQVSFRNLKDNL